MAEIPMAARNQGFRRLGRFSVVGALNTLIDIAVFMLLVKVFSLPVVPANLLAFSVALANSYILNRLWTFHDSTAPHSVGNIFRFVLFNTAAALLATATLAALVTLNLPILAAKVLSIGVSMTWNYLTMRYLVFKAPPRSPA